MDGASLKGSPRAARLEGQRADVERVREEDQKRWDLVVAAVPAQLDSRRFFAAPSEVAEPWRSTDGTLTAGVGRGAAAAPSGEAVHDASSRLQLSVDGGRLGKLSVGLSRGEAGTSVFLGAEDGDGVAALSAEKAALTRALEAAGVKVASVKIVPAAEVGILLARSGEKPPAGTPSREAEESSRQEPKRRQKKLHFTG